MLPLASLNFALLQACVYVHLLSVHAYSKGKLSLNASQFARSLFLHRSLAYLLSQKKKWSLGQSNSENFYLFKVQDNSKTGRKEKRGWEEL